MSVKRQIGTYLKILENATYKCITGKIVIFVKQI